MSYNQDFFEQYKNYLLEPVVRNAHNWMFHIFETVWPSYPLNIIDFGCGQCCEYRQYGHPENWFGFDLNPPDEPNTHKCDYRTFTDIKVPFPIYGFVSLFSTECCLDKWEKYSFYDKIFYQYPIKAALVSGFYYENKIKEEWVHETGGIASWQSIEDQKLWVCSETQYIELRTHIRVPSKMFGEDVVEVWKILMRKS